MTLTVAVTPSSVKKGETVNLALMLAANQPVELQFRSGQRFDFEIADASGSVIWKWSEGQMFTQALGTEQMEEGDERRYDASWEATHTGTLEVTGRVTAMGREDLSDSTSLTVG